MSARTIAINAGRCDGSPCVFVPTGFVSHKGSLGSEYWEIAADPGRAEPSRKYSKM